MPGEPAPPLSLVRAAGGDIADQRDFEFTPQLKIKLKLLFGDV